MFSYLLGGGGQLSGVNYNNAHNVENMQIVGHEIITVASMKMALLCLVAPRGHHRPEDGGSNDL
jgi:hypothetical protein